jgi:hypothetical protein
MSSRGRSWGFVGVNPILFTICIPEETLPKIVCLPSNQGQGANLKINEESKQKGYVIKNWEPLVFGPLFAIDRIPAPVCFKSRVISSSNLSP